MPQMDPVTPARPEVSALLSTLDGYTPAQAEAAAKQLCEAARLAQRKEMLWTVGGALLFPAFVALVLSVSMLPSLQKAILLVAALALAVAMLVPSAYFQGQARLKRADATAYDPVSTAELERLIGLVEPHPELCRVIAIWSERGIAIRKHEADLLEEAATVLEDDRIRQRFASLGQPPEVAHG